MSVPALLPQVSRHAIPTVAKFLLGSDLIEKDVLKLSQCPLSQLVCGAEEFAAIAGRQDLAAIAERPDVMARVGYLLETLRGCMRGTNSRAQPALFSLASAVMSPLVRFL